MGVFIYVATAIGGTAGGFMLAYVTEYMALRRRLREAHQIGGAQEVRSELSARRREWHEKGPIGRAAGLGLWAAIRHFEQTNSVNETV